MAKSKKRSPRSSSKKRYSKKVSKKRSSYKKRSSGKKRQSPCRSFRTKPQCLAARDSKGSRRCSSNVRTGKCQDVRVASRGALTTFVDYRGKMPTARPTVGRLSPQRLQLNKPTMMETESGQIIPLAPGNVPMVKLQSGEVVPVSTIPAAPGRPGMRMERTASGAMVPVAPSGPIGRGRVAFAYAFY